MSQWVPTFLIVAGLVAAPLPAVAQSPLWDGSFNLGLLSGQRRDLNEWSSWYSTGTYSAELGRYLTPHLKVSLDAGRSGEGEIFSQQQVIVPGQPSPNFIYEQHFLERSYVSGSVSYQFFENAWVHPFVTAGAQHAWEQDRVRVQGTSSGRLPPPPPTDSVVSRTRVRPFVGAGAKFYLTPRAFAQGQVQVAPGPDGAHIAANGGFGVDFGRMSRPAVAHVAHVAPVAPVAPLAPAAPVWRTFAKQLAPGTAIRLRLADGSSLRATLLQASDDDITIQPKTRVAVEVRNVPYTSVVSIQLDDEKGRQVAKAVGIGVASGVAAFVGMLLVMVASFD
jgi:hypothetical protein